MKIIFGIFMILHGLVHLLYLGQSARYFELQPGMLWPDGAWAFSKPLGTGPTRMIANIGCVIAAVGFVAGGIGVFAGQSWWQPFVVASTLFSCGLYILCWDGTLRALNDQGGIALLINVAILAAVLVFKWPDLP